MTYQGIYNNTKSGLPNGSLVGTLSTPVDVQPYAGRFGNAGTEPALTKKNYQKPLRDYNICLFFSNLLGRFIQWGDAGKDSRGCPEAYGLCTQGASPWGCYHPPGGRTRWRRRWMIGWLRLSWWFCTSVMLYCVVLGFWDILYAFVGDSDLEILGQTFLEF